MRRLGSAMVSGARLLRWGPMFIFSFAATSSFFLLSTFDNNQSFASVNVTVPLPSGSIIADSLSRFQQKNPFETSSQPKTVQSNGAHPAGRPVVVGHNQTSRIPTWLQEYAIWHREELEKLNSDQESWKEKRYLILACTKAVRPACGGLSDRLKPVPLILLIAKKTNRVFFIHWTKPWPLEEFLLPKPDGINWTIPTWLISSINAPGTDRVMLNGGRHLVSTAPSSKLAIFSHIHDARGGCEMYDETEGKGSFYAIYHDVFRLLFEPVPAIANAVRARMEKHGLQSNQFAVAHFRADYGFDNQNIPLLASEGHQRKLAVNAVNCASSLMPGAPVYFASDSSHPIQIIREFAAEHHYPIVAPETADDKDPLHLDKAGPGHSAEEYYSIFVDLLVMAEGRCVAVGKGGYGIYASLLSYNSSCWKRHQLRVKPKMCDGAWGTQ